MAVEFRGVPTQSEMLICSTLTRHVFLTSAVELCFFEGEMVYGGFSVPFKHVVSV